jgi:hypothetical protein
MPGAYTFDADAEPDARDVLNASVPIRPAAAAMPRAPKVTEREPDEKPRTPRAFLAALTIALRDAKSADEADKIVCSEDVLRAKEVFTGEAKAQLDKLIADTMRTWFSEPPAEEPVDELRIHNEEKLAG